MCWGCWMYPSLLQQVSTPRADSILATSLPCMQVLPTISLMLKLLQHLDGGEVARIHCHQLLRVLSNHQSICTQCPSHSGASTPLRLCFFLKFFQVFNNSGACSGMSSPFHSHRSSESRGENTHQTCGMDPKIRNHRRPIYL